jgi:hypothetical protein
MVAPVELTTHEFRRTADSIAAQFDAQHLRIEPGSHLDFMLGELRWVGKFKDLFTDAAAVDRPRTINALLLQEQLSHLESALVRLRAVPNLRMKLQHLRKNPLNTLVLRSGNGLETLFELEVASRLVRPSWDVSFEEPDILWKLESGGQLGIACKRPQKRKNLASNLLGGSDQIKRSGVPGYVLLSVDGFIDAFFGRVESQDELGRRAKKRVEELLNEITPAIKNAFDRGIGGVLICGRFLGIATTPSSYCWTFPTAMTGNLEFEGASQGLECINEVLTGHNWGAGYGPK